METKMKVMGEMSWVKLKIKLSTANAENCRPIQADTIGHDDNLLPSCSGSFWISILTKSFIKDISDEWGLFYCENIARWLRGRRAGLNVGLQSILEAVSRPFVNRTRGALQTTTLFRRKKCIKRDLGIKAESFSLECRSGWKLRRRESQPVFRRITFIGLF